MLRTLSSGEGAVTALAAARTASVSVIMRPVIGIGPHCRFILPTAVVTTECWGGSGATSRSPPKPFRLARQLDGLDLLELDGALGHEIVDIAIGRAGDFRAIEIDLERAAMVLLGPCRGIADAVHAGRHPILLLVEAFGDVLSGRAAVFGGPVDRFLHVQRGADGCDIVHG